jgi:hypothetical protein
MIQDNGQASGYLHLMTAATTPAVGYQSVAVFGIQANSTTGNYDWVTFDYRNTIF